MAPTTAAHDDSTDQFDRYTTPDVTWDPAGNVVFLTDRPDRAHPESDILPATDVRASQTARSLPAVNGYDYATDACPECGAAWSAFGTAVTFSQRPIPPGVYHGLICECGHVERESYPFSEMSSRSGE